MAAAAGALAAHQVNYDFLVALQFPGLLNVVGRQLKDTLTFLGTTIV
jgi:hypothetical protein